MQGTFKLPSGRKIRSQSQRRYILVSDGVPTIVGVRGEPRIDRRSDKVDTLRRYARLSTHVILDTVTGSVV